MPVPTSYPGVYIQEQPSGVHTIVGVSTSVTAFVGAARLGPTNTPIEVHSVAEYTRNFGAPWDRDHPMGHTVGHFFGNGGSQAVIVRVPASGAKTATVTLKDKNAVDKVLTLTANGEGAWANRVGALGMDVTIDYDNSANPADLFDLVISLHGTDPRSGVSVLQAQETYRNLSMGDKNPRYVKTVLASSTLVGPVSDLTIGVITPTAHGHSQSKAALVGPVKLPTNPVLTLAVDGGPPTDLPFTPIANPAPGDVVDALNNALPAAGLLAHASLDITGLLLVTSTGPDIRNSSVVVTPSAAGDASHALGMGLTWGGTEVSGSAALRPDLTTAPAALAGGSEGGTPTGSGIVGSGDVIPGGTAPTKGIYALSSRLFPRFNLLCLPDVPASDPNLSAIPGTNSQDLTTAMAYCKQQRAFLLVDTPGDASKVPANNWTTSPPALGGLPALGEHAAIYYPRLLVSEAGPGGITRQFDIPPCGAVAGVMAATDASRGVWKAPAGLGAGIVGASDLSVGTSDDVSGLLNPMGVNVLRTFPGAGMVVWGARTLKGADSQTSDFKYIPVRRITDYIASSLYLGTQFAVFEPNDPELWGQLRLAVGTFMRGLFRQGAFQQSPKRSESDSFFVVCDETVNPQSEIDLGRVNVVVGFAPLKPAEFVIVTITQISNLEA